MSVFIKWTIYNIYVMMSQLTVIYNVKMWVIFERAMKLYINLKIYCILIGQHRTLCTKIILNCYWVLKNKFHDLESSFTYRTKSFFFFFSIFIIFVIILWQFINLYLILHVQFILKINKLMNYRNNIEGNIK